MKRRWNSTPSHRITPTKIASSNFSTCMNSCNLLRDFQRPRTLILLQKICKLNLFKFIRHNSLAKEAIIIKVFQRFFCTFTLHWAVPSPLLGKISRMSLSTSTLLYIKIFLLPLETFQRLFVYIVLRNFPFPPGNFSNAVHWKIFLLPLKTFEEW